MASATRMSLVDTDLILSLVDKVVSAIPRSDPIHKQIQSDNDSMQRVLNSSNSDQRKVQLYEHHLGEYLDHNQQQRQQQQVQQPKRRVPATGRQVPAGQEAGVEGRASLAESKEQQALLSALQNRGVGWLSSGEIVIDGRKVSGSQIKDIITSLTAKDSKLWPTPGGAELLNHLKKKAQTKTILNKEALKLLDYKPAAAAAPVQDSEDDDDELFQTPPPSPRRKRARKTVMSPKSRSLSLDRTRARTALKNQDKLLKIMRLSKPQLAPPTTRKKK